jgi:putative RecB family exonuclease
MKFSYSKLNVFLTCPLQFKYKYIDKLRDKEITDNYATYLGRGMHECLQWLYGNKDKEWSSLESKWIALSSRMIGEANEKTPEVFREMDTCSMFKNQGRKILRNYYEGNQKEFQSPDHSTIALEKFFITTFKEFTLTGVIDKVEKIKNTIYIVDYKTGKPRPQQEVDENLQLSFYAVACRRAGLALGNIEFCMDYVKHNTRIMTTRSIDDVKKLYYVLREVYDKINNNKFDPTPGDSACRYCEHKKICPAFSIVEQKE